MFGWRDAATRISRQNSCWFIVKFFPSPKQRNFNYSAQFWQPNSRQLTASIHLSKDSAKKLHLRVKSCFVCEKESQQRFCKRIPRLTIKLSHANENEPKKNVQIQWSHPYLVYCVLRGRFLAETDISSSREVIIQIVDSVAFFLTIYLTCEKVNSKGWRKILDNTLSWWYGIRWMQALAARDGRWRATDTVEKNRRHKLTFISPESWRTAWQNGQQTWYRCCWVGARWTGREGIKRRAAATSRLFDAAGFTSRLVLNSSDETCSFLMLAHVTVGGSRIWCSIHPSIHRMDGPILDPCQTCERVSRSHSRTHPPDRVNKSLHEDASKFEGWPTVKGQALWNSNES